jgi:uncharacterized protein (TIGR02145 family)
LGVPLRVGLSVPSPRSFLAPGFPLQSLTPCGFWDQGNCANCNCEAQSDEATLPNFLVFLIILHDFLQVDFYGNHVIVTQIFFIFTSHHLDVKHLYLFGILLSLPFFGFSQGEWNNWYFGTKAGVTFNSGTPQYLMDSQMSANRSLATVSDSLGNLLFYTDGRRVYDRTHSITPNGTGLLSWIQDQSVCVVQNIGDDSLYYIFTLNCPVWPPPQPDGGLHYSVVDMRLNGGLGDIVTGQKNISLLGNANWPVSMTMARHHNNKDAWLIIHNGLSNHNFYVFLITSGGIQEPVVSSSILYNPLISTNPGSMRVSPDGTKLIAPYPITDSLEYCQFNSSTGQITSLFCINTDAGPDMDGGWSYLEFSIDSRYLYRSSNDWDNAYIFQYDVALDDSALFKQSEIIVGHSLHGVHLQMGPDWKIYGDESVIDSMCVINNPTTGGIGCNFQANSVYLNLRDCGHGLPQFLQKYKAYIHHTSSLCENKPIHFSGDIWPPADSIHWDFGDPVSGPSNFSNLANASHTYSNVGTYIVELFVRHIDHRTDTTWQTITILASPQVNLGSDRTVCTGDSTTFDAGACTGCTYLWKDLGSGLPVGTAQTFRTDQAGTYAVTVTNSNNCIGTDTVQLTTTPFPTVTNNPLSKTICSGESTNSPLTSNVPGTTFHWAATLTMGNITGYSADSGLVINQILINSLSTPGIVTYHITPKVGSCIGTTVDFPVTVNVGDSVKVSISSSNNNICAGTTVIFTATPTNPGTTPNYQWKVNGNNSGTNSTTFTYTPLNGDVVTCLLTSSLTSCISNNPALSNSILMVIDSVLIVNISINPSSNPVCAGISVTFTATPVNGGTTPSYQWKVNDVNAGTNSPVYSYVPLNGDQVNCELTSSVDCPLTNPVTSNTLSMTTNNNLPVSLVIAASANPFCPGSSVTFTTTPTNGGTTPSFQWKVNGANAGTDSPNYTYNPANGDMVSCVLTSSVACPITNPITSNTLLMTINNSLPAGVSITASSNPFCPGSSVTFTATPINGGSTPSYQWKVNGVNVGTNSSTYSYDPVDGDSVRCVMTSNLSCVTGNPASSAKIIMSGTLAPIVTFTSCFDTITMINAKPIKLKGGIPLGGVYSGPGVNSLTGIFTPALAGIGTHTITYTYTNAELCSALAHTHIINYPLSIVNCGSPITDIRDNQVYQTVQIGTQCWLASNLNYGTILTSSQDQRDNCLVEKYCYNDNPINCTNYGGLYQWDKLMLFDETPANQGFCPPGWHIPSENDWNTLFANYINNGFAGSPLKYSGYSGFNALLSGARHINKGWDFQGFATFFWSSTSLGSTKAWANGINEDDPSVSVYSSSRVNAFSVRCLKD